MLPASCMDLCHCLLTLAVRAVSVTVWKHWNLMSLYGTSFSCFTKWAGKFFLQLNKKWRKGDIWGKQKNKCTFNLYLLLCVITFPHNLLQLQYTFANVQQVSEFCPKKSLACSWNRWHDAASLSSSELKFWSLMSYFNIRNQSKSQKRDADSRLDVVAL